MTDIQSASNGVLPTVTTGNTHAPCVIIGEPMAEILKRQNS